jgi:hypothetical protein
MAERKPDPIPKPNIPQPATPHVWQASQIGKRNVWQGNNNGRGDQESSRKSTARMNSTARANVFDVPSFSCPHVSASALKVAEEGDGRNMGAGKSGHTSKACSHHLSPLWPVNLDALSLCGFGASRVRAFRG